MATAKQPPTTAAKQPHPNYTAQSAKQLHGTRTTKPKKLASTVTPLQNNWSPLALQKELLRHAYSEAVVKQN